MPKSIASSKEKVKAKPIAKGKAVTKKKTAGRPKTKSASSSKLGHGGDVVATILSVAKKHFAKYGYQGVNLKDIAWEASVANSLITYHFKGKEGLYRSCVEGFAKDRMDAINRLLKDPETVEELKLRLSLFVEENLLNYIKDPESFQIIFREVESHNPIALKIFEETFLKSFTNVVEFFSRAKKRGLISSLYDPILIASFLFSATCDNAQKDHLGKKYFGKTMEDPVWRQKMSEQIVNLFMNGVISEKS